MHSIQLQLEEHSIASSPFAIENIYVLALYDYFYGLDHGTDVLHFTVAFTSNLHLFFSPLEQSKDEQSGLSSSSSIKDTCLTNYKSHSLLTWGTISYNKVEMSH